MHKETKEAFYLANSQDLIIKMHRLNMLALYPMIQDFCSSVRELRPLLTYTPKQSNADRQE
jgi:hypothetical protein